MMNLLADTGGFIGLLFGVSVITVIEFLFMGTLSVFHFITNKPLSSYSLEKLM
jgi:hypothetical protein